MKKKSVIKRISAIAMALVLTGSMAAVAGPIQASAAVRKVAVSNLPAKTLTLKKGKSKVLKVAVTVNAGSSKAYTVKSSNKSIATAKATKSGVKVSGKKDGQAKITIASKVKKKKKVVINVTVGTPASKVNVKAKAKVLKGGKLQMKATISPSNASNKNVVWSSADTSIATVSAAGVVKGKKIGKVKITALAADGSGKKKSCTVEVVKKNGVQKFEMINSYTAQLTLVAPQKLSQNKIKIDKKYYDVGKYIEEADVLYMETSDNQTYYIGFEDRISQNTYVRAEVKGLKNAKKATVENFYKRASYVYDREVIWTETVGEEVEHTVYGSSLSGYEKATVKNLPAGLKYDAEEHKIYGKPTKAGKFVTTVSIQDELGDKETIKITWLIGSPTVMVAAALDEYAYLTNAERQYVYTHVDAEGGSGSYKYEITDKGGLDVSIYEHNGELEGWASKVGTYTVKVKVTDRENTARTTTVAVKIHVKKGNEVILHVKDAAGQYIKSADVEFVNTVGGNKIQGYAYASSEKNDGIYKAYVENGTWDVYVYAGNCTKVTRINVSGNATHTINAPMNTVTLTIPSTIKNQDLIEWEDEDEGYVGRGKTLYLKKGTYKLKATHWEKLVKYELEVNLTVSGKSAKATAKITSTERPDTLAVGTNKSATLTTTEKKYVFTVSQSGYYYFTTQSNRDTVGCIYNEDGMMMYNDDDGGEGSNFYIEVYLEAGRTYGLGAKMYSGEATSTVVIESGYVEEEYY